MIRAIVCALVVSGCVAAPVGRVQHEHVDAISVLLHLPNELACPTFCDSPNAFLAAEIVPFEQDSIAALIEKRGGGCAVNGAQLECDYSGRALRTNVAFEHHLTFQLAADGGRLKLQNSTVQQSWIES